LLLGAFLFNKRADGTVKDELVWLFDFQDVANNEFLAVNQFTIIEERNNRRPDIIYSLMVCRWFFIELKNPADENATVWSAYNQLGTYKLLDSPQFAATMKSWSSATVC
jgi:type I restriction enzyme, R subunit